MITDFFLKNSSKILMLFSISPGSKFTRNEIKEKTMLHNIPLDRAINILLNNNILIKEKRLLSLGLENNNVKSIVDLMRKEYIRFKEISLKIYYLLMDVSSELSENSSIKSIYLFGSYAKLIHTEKSDVDLAIVLKKNIEKEIKKIIAKIEKKYGEVIEIHFFDEKDMKQKDKLIKEILRNNVEIF
jgi:uncharacterized protein